jgi:hypothetical protein
MDNFFFTSFRMWGEIVGSLESEIMRKVILAVSWIFFAATSVALLGTAAQAGDYYGGSSYAPRHYGQVWYSSSCCYRRVVRHERSVYYVPAYGGGYYSDRHYGYRGGYYGPPW